MKMAWAGADDTWRGHLKSLWLRWKLKFNPDDIPKARLENIRYQLIITPCGIKCQWVLETWPGKDALDFGTVEPGGIIPVPYGTNVIWERECMIPVLEEPS